MRFSGFGGFESRSRSPEEYRTKRDALVFDDQMRRTFAEQRALVESAPVCSTQAVCPKCGGVALPKYQREVRGWGGIPERIMMTCQCGYAWPTKPKDSASALSNEELLRKYGGS